MASERGSAVAVLLLTGGYSRRFANGMKLEAKVTDGNRVIDVVADNLSQVGLPVFEAGLGMTDFNQITGTQFTSPLVALAKGFSVIAEALGDENISIMVLAGDMVALDPITITRVATFPSARSVVPFDGSLQVLGARWGHASLALARSMAMTHPKYSLRSALGEGVVILDDRRWRVRSPFSDIDTFEDLEDFKQNRR
ncbi:MAG: hypothetical protein M0019_05460 [Actinomycetota bacterium]|nr:hypothetical protein [Actinomycetota bacterium]